MRFDLVVGEYMKRNMSTPGLYLLRLILKEFATNRNTDIIHQITDLQRVSVHNNNLEDFLNLWDLILGQMHPEDHPNPRHQQHYFLEALRKVQPLAMDMALYDRMEDDDPNKTYDWLRKVCERQICRGKKAKAALIAQTTCNCTLI